MTLLPRPLLKSLIPILKSLGDSSVILDASPVSGGCINHTLHLRTTSKQYLLKWNSTNRTGLFQSEVYGLDLIRASQTIRVPEVIFTSDPPLENCPAFLLLEWIEPPNSLRQSSHAQFGERLAALHLSSRSLNYGLDRDNFIGPTPQCNHWAEDWIEFYTLNRLIPQMNLAAQNGRLPLSRQKKLENLITNLEHWLGGIIRQPALIHGDMWIGNLIFNHLAEPVLIDPAVYYADREAEIAYTLLFGGFNNLFYQSYQAVWPLEPGFEQRINLYNLYHLLNHLNLFGEKYGLMLDDVLRLYVG